MEVFGPVPSRRLGQSLGINHIPPKTCSYACIYCQLGQTQNMSVSRNIYTEPEMLRRQVGQKLGQVRASGQTVDYLTFVPDGEPTLDSRLGQAICQLKVYKTPIAVISNASLIWREDVQEELSAADWVSLKIDAATERLWKRINRPHRSLKLPEILNGIEQFAHRYSGNLVTETMLVAGYNDEPEQVEAIARQIGRIRPKTAYLLVPTR
ncbi:MAG: radical SAM protein, partial [Clostridiaceae bacterium]|nr:radical SAM protein [Clostridiaceae bacterium]